MTKTIIRFTQVTRGRGPKLSRYVWVEGVKWADGDGHKVKSVSFTTDRTKAARFSTITAHDVAVQYFRSPAALELADGGVLVEDTATLLFEQDRKFQLARTVQAQFREEMRSFFSEMPEDLRRSVMVALFGNRKTFAAEFGFDGGR